VPLVVVGAFLGQPEVDRQQRLGAVHRMDLGLLVDRQHDRAAGRVQIQADDVGDLRRERRVPRQVERALPYGCKPWSRHSFATYCQDTVTPSLRCR
jgi:hypothetical protein